MNNLLKTYEYGTPEFERLSIAAQVLTAISPHKYKYRVEDTYFDFGQDWMWTTIIAYRPDGESYQALDPVRHVQILNSENLLWTLSEIIQNKYWLDK